MMNYTQLSRIDLNLLVVFDLLFSERHAGRTAAALNISPSAVSHSLRRLRAYLGDPLFLPTARGMAPTARAEMLAPAIRDIVERVGAVMVKSEPFDPATSRRRFRIAAPDGSAAILIPRLVETLEQQAAGIDLAMLQLLPAAGATEPREAWREALSDVANGRIDVAIIPHQPSSSRFHPAWLYTEDFIFAARRGHELGDSPTLGAIASARHVLVSATGDRSGLVDLLLAKHGHERRIALTVPSFLAAAAAIAKSQLVGALPRRFVNEACLDFDLQPIEPPFPMIASELYAIAARSALIDPAIAWLLDQVTACLLVPDKS